MHGWFLHQRPDEFVICLDLPEFESAKNKMAITYGSCLGLMLSTYFIIGKNQTDRLSSEIVSSYKKISDMMGWKFGNIP